jgi:D-alanyl-D-alanine carboxypeptidase
VTDRVTNADRITLRMLLSHTSGIPEWVNDEVHILVGMDPARIWSSDDALDVIADEPASFEPGSAWSYSNTNYTLVGMVLDRFGGSTWREQIRTRILEPLELSSTLLPEPGDLATPGDYARGYVDVDGTPLDLTQVDPSMAGPAGGSAMITTAQDLATFLDALLAGELFQRKATLEAMTTMIEAPHESGWPHRYGLGLESFDMPGLPTVIGHSGGSPGYAAMMFRIPERGATLVTAINTGDLFANALQVFIPAAEVVAAGD